MSEHATHYTVSDWKGNTVYNCAHCRYKTLVEAEIGQHIRQVHSSQYTLRPAKGGLISKDGSPMNVLEEQPPKEPPRAQPEDDSAGGSGWFGGRQ